MPNVVNTFEKGLSLDTSPLNQPKGTSPFILNGVAETKSGDQGGTSNEAGFLKDIDILSEATLLGQIVLDKEQVVLFIKKDSTGESEIGLYDKPTNVYTPLSNDGDLQGGATYNFQLAKEIVGTYRFIKGCDRKIYWTDGVNPIRTLNIDQDNIEDDIDLINLFQDAQIPDFFFIEQSNSGGEVLSGQYQFAAQYLDENFNATAFLAISNGQSVFTEEVPNPDGFAAIDGNINIGEFTNKSLIVTLQNVDTSFTYVRLAVIKNGGTSINLINEVSITGSTLQIVYTGTPDEKEAITVTDLITPDISYDTAETLTQSENKLIIANLTNSNEYNYQPYANNIVVEYRVDETENVPYIGSGALGYPEPLNIFANNMRVKRSMMRDEVYALGIVWVFKDGSESEAFHIPGRAKITGATPFALPYVGAVTLTDGDSTDVKLSSDAQSDGAPTPPPPGAVEAWEIYNTAHRLIPPNTGNCGYYEEGTEVYPNEDIYDSTSLGGEDLRGTPVRHHRMPDCSLEPLVTNDVDGVDYTKRLLSVKFTNIEVPADLVDLVVGYRPVIVNRTEDNSRVLSKGAFSTCLYNNGTDAAHNGIEPVMPCYDEDFYKSFGSYAGSSGGIQVEGSIFHMISPEILEGIISTNNVDQVTIDSEITTTSGVYPLQTSDARGGGGSFIGSRTIKSIAKLNTFLPAHSGVVNRDLDDKFFIGDTFSRPNVKGSLDYMINSSGRDATNGFVFSTVTNSTIIPTPSPGDDSISLDGTPGVAKGVASMYYGSLIKKRINQYDPVSQLVYHDRDIFEPITAAGTYSLDNIFLGDTFISWWGVRRSIHEGIPDAPTNNALGLPWIDDGAVGITDDDTPDHLYGGIVGFWHESTINLELRHEASNGPTAANTAREYLKYPSQHVSTLPQAYQYLHGAGVDGVDETVLGWRLDYLSEYSVLQTLKPYFAVSLGREYSDCIQLSTRVAYSQSGFSDDRADSFRIFKSLDYRDLPSHRGEVNDLFSQPSLLFAHCEDGIWRINTTENQLQTSELAIVVGTGEFFSLDPIELVDVDGGYGGTKSRLANFNCPFGHFFVDEKRGKFFLYESQLDDISSKGAFHFFKENIPNRYSQRFTNFTDTDNPASKFGLGYTAVYDDRLKRIIVSKKDYDIPEELLPSFKGALQLASPYLLGDLVMFNERSLVRVNVNHTPLSTTDLKNNSDEVYVHPDDTAVGNATGFKEGYAGILQNVGFTMSYYLPTQSWRSFHSYFPTNAFNIHDKVIFKSDFPFEASATRFMYTANEGDNGNYFDRSEYHPFIVEGVVNDSPTETKVFDAQSIICEAVEVDSSTGEEFEDPDITFNKAILYTRRMCTGEITLNTDATPNTDNAVNAEEGWNFNDIWDIVINPRNSFWERLKVSVMGTTHWIDKELDGANLNASKDWHEQQRLRDKYMVFRYIYDNLTTRKLTLSGVLTLIRKSFR